MKKEPVEGKKSIEDGDFGVFEYSLFIKREVDWKTGEEIALLAREKDWKGTGTKENPFIIDSQEGLPQKLFIKSSDLFIKFNNFKFEVLELYKCHNITFNECKFKKLSLRRSGNIMAKDSNISKLNLIGSKNNLFKRCNIERGINSNTRENTFESCEVGDDFKKSLLESGLNPLLLSWVKFFLPFTILALATYIIFYDLNSLKFELTQILIALGLTSIVVILLSLLYINFKNKKNPNKII